MKKSQLIFNYFALLLILGSFLSCTATKQLDSIKLEKTQLEMKLTEIQSKMTAKEEAYSILNAEKQGIAEDLANAKEAKMTCENDLSTIKTAYDSFHEKLLKLKKEVQAAFPNNLDEPNFSIVEEDGRLVITLPNKILYARGKSDFDAEALLVIQKLSKVFRNNQGLQILVEGHTDEIPLQAGSKFKDNWDLSLARAVNVVRKLELYGVHPARLTAAGRGYFSPKSTLANEEARALNRRTEIIIRPKTAELLMLLSEVD